MKLKTKNKKNKGFTLIELLIVIAIIGLLSSVVLAASNKARAKARDSRRVADMKQLITAINLYYSDNGVYPPVTNPVGPGSWETSLNTFLPGLVTGGYISKQANDPLNRIFDTSNLFVHAGNYYYAYYNYPASSAASYGCAFNAPFTVIGVKEMEGGTKPEFSQAHCGTPPQGGCPTGGILNVCRDWSTEFDYAYLVTQ
jgi:prepilin-type N-terminal cleavage/methylation domain-containing protein